MIVSAIAAGTAVGRTWLSDKIDARVQSSIDVTAQEVRSRIRAEADTFLSSRYAVFVRNLLIKALILCAAWVAHRADLLPVGVYPIIIVTLLIVFTIRDTWVIFPTLRAGFHELRKHGWRPKRTISELVAANVFDEVLDKAGEVKVGRAHSALLAIAGQSRDDISKEIAAKVSQIARETSWDDIQPFVMRVALRGLCLMALYSLLLLTVIY